MTIAQDAVVIDRNLLSRVIALINQKCGVGKTSCVANVAVEYARAGWKVLVLELDPQGNLGMEFGYRPSRVGKAEPDPRDDKGAGLAQSLTTGAPLTVTLTAVRSYANGGQIDVIPSGAALKAVPIALGTFAVMMKQPYESKLTELLLPIAGDYDVILIDCPPADMVLRSMALDAARYILAPTKSDPASWEEGLDSLVDEIYQARGANELLQILGVILFDVAGTKNTEGTKNTRETRKEINDLFTEAFADDPFGIPPVFQSTIRHAEVPAKASRVQGRTMSEIAIADLSGPSLVQILKLKEAGEDVSTLLKGRPASGSTANVASDYAALGAEIVQAIWVIEEAKKAQKADQSVAASTAVEG
jgi:chromosome partitioning protein